MNVNEASWALREPNKMQRRVQAATQALANAQGVVDHWQGLLNEALAAVPDELEYEFDGAYVALNATPMEEE